MHNFCFCAVEHKIIAAGPAFHVTDASAELGNATGSITLLEHYVQLRIVGIHHMHDAIMNMDDLTERTRVQRKEQRS